MIISKTPYRMSFFGGGTDYNSYFMKHGGSVISTTIDKYCYVFIRKSPPFLKHRYHLKYSIVENVDSMDDIKHPSVRACLQYLNVSDISLAHDGDLPARSGIGSSSAFTVGTLNALHSLKGEFVGAKQIAKEAIYVEQELLKENVGIQDQIAVSCGGFNHIVFSADGFELRPIIISKERKKTLEDNLLLFFTGLQRFASNVAKEQIKNTERNLEELKNIANMTEEAAKILQGTEDMSSIGFLLDEMWKHKKKLARSVSNEFIDSIYMRAKRAGALGGKLMGAGGGGFIYFYVEPPYQQQVIEELSDILYIPFQFENGGSQIIYADSIGEYI